MMFEAASTLRSIQQIVLMPVAEKRNQQALWVTWAVLILGLLTCALLLKIGQPRIGLMIVSALVFATAIAWWMIFIGCVQRQCTQINRQLVPRLTQKTIVLTTSLWLTGSILLALIEASQIGSLFFLWLVISLGMCLCVWFSRFQKMTALITITFVICLRGRINLNFFESSTYTCVATILAMLTFAVFTFAKILLPRKPRSNSEQRRKSAHLAQAQGPINQPMLPGIINTLLGGRWLYLWLLKCALSKQASPTQLMSFMFGPRGHWSKTAIFSLDMVSLIALIWIFVPGEPNPNSNPSLFIYMTALIGFWFSSSHSLAPRDWLLTRREQGLLLLAPKFPQGRKLNESLGNFIISSHNAKFLQMVILFVTYSLTYDPLKNAGSFQIVASFEILFAAYLIILGLQFRSLAHLKNRPDLDYAAFLKTLVLAMLTLSPLVLIGIFFGIAATCIVLLAYISTGAIFLIWRWRRLLDGPASLPAGRLADN